MSGERRGGMGFLGGLGLLFIGLKLGAVIDWSWWWVLAPIWAPLALAAVLFLLVGIGALIEKYAR